MFIPEKFYYRLVFGKGKIEGPELMPGHYNKISLREMVKSLLYGSDMNQIQAEGFFTL